MSNGVTVANANPLDAGADANSVESAAQGFTELLKEENEPRPRSSGRRASREDDDTLFSDTVDDPDVAQPDDGQSPEEADEGDRDPVLDGDDADGDKPDAEDPKDEDEDPDAEDGEEDDEDAEDDAEDDDDEALMEREFEVTVNGEVLKQPLKEIIAGYSREADYRQKTAQLSEEKRELFEYANEVVAERKEYADKLQGWVDMTAALEPSQEDWEALKKTNPQLYIQTKEQWDGISAKVAEAKAERERIAAREAEEETRRYSEWVRSQNQRLSELVPALKNPKKAEAFRNAIFTYGKEAGYSEEELMTGAVDARDVLTLYKASRYDEIMRSRKTGQRPGKKDPKPSVTTRPRNVSKNGKAQTTRQLRDADKRLQRSGSVDDAAVAFTNMLKM